MHDAADATALFEEAISSLEDRQVVGSVLRSAEWRDKVAVGLRNRAFFSARVENARVLQTMQDYLLDFLNKAVDPETGGLKAQGRAEFVAEMRELCAREGLGTVDPETGEIAAEIDENDLTDLRSMARLQLIFDTQVEQANEYGYWSQGNDPDVLAAFPAQRFLRVRPVRVPRPIHAANEGAVRRKDDLNFWISMNPDFGVPWGPWGFNSGMGVEDVDRIEAEELGLVAQGERLAQPERDLNDRLSASVRDMSPELVAELREGFWKQIELRDGRAWWAGDTVGKDIANRGMKPTAAMKKIIAEYTVSQEEGQIYHQLNQQMRGGELTPAMEKRAAAMREALAALPDARGTFWRKTGELPTDFLARYKTGETVIERFFISTSKNKNLKWKRNDIRWRIDSLTGKNIAAISTKPDQEEVLFPTNRVFRVLYSGPDPDVPGKWYIHLREER
jgi:hypothetical protein